MNSSSTILQSKLNEYKLRAYEKISNWIPEKEPKKYLYDLIMDYPSRGGKGFRPAICIATFNCFGGKGDKCDNTAAALELFHNAFLVHDDVEDDSILRRGSLTINKVNNNAIAVNLGDAMNVLGLKGLGLNRKLLGNSMSSQILDEVETMLTETVEGQSIELGWRKENNTDLEVNDYFRMILKKTCWYTTIYPIRLGHFISTNKGDSNMFYKFGYYMGLSFQIQDDILNLKGAESLYGKEVYGDIVEGKRTLMLIDLLNKCTIKEKKDVMHYLSDEMSKDEKISSFSLVLDLMNKYNSIESCIQISRIFAGAALKEFMDKFKYCKPTEDREFMKELVLYMVNRNL